MTPMFTAVYQAAEEGGFIAFVEELPGANTQGETLEEARENLRDAVKLILSMNRYVPRHGAIASGGQTGVSVLHVPRLDVKRPSAYDVNRA